MKNYLFFINIILVMILILILVFLPKAIFAQTLISDFLPNCGFADVEGQDKCCETSFNFSEDIDRTKEKMPQSIRPAFDIISDTTENIVEKTPIGKFVKKCYLGEPDESSGTCICKQTLSPTPIKSLEEICNKFTIGSEKNFCISCAQGGGILTAIGCVPLNLGNFISDFLLKRLIGLAGVVALLCIIYSAFTLQTSQGNPEKIKKAQELLTSCIMGLMLIIFSVFILRLIGVDILMIPGFGK